MPTTLDQEQAEQRRWKLRPEWSRFPWPEKLLRNEFLSPDQMNDLVAQSIRRIVDFSAAEVPFYQRRFAEAGLRPSSLQSSDDLPMLPVLTRSDLQEHKTELKAGTLPKGYKVTGMAKTSGSTGQPVEVILTDRSSAMFPIVKQRQMRWGRFDPMAKLAIIRPAHDLPSLRNGRHAELGETVHQKNWDNQVGPYFFTGPLVGYNNRNPIEDQIDWLTKHAPDYLLCQAAELEHLALAFQARNRPLKIHGLLAIAQDLTPEMRTRIEQVFSGSVEENYGLNEVGIVATYCREGDRYHINVEHCLVEIVDEGGQPVAPGEAGHLLVTAFNNPAMPLLRYDSGDIAEAITGPCPCGRNLPAFGRIIGRYRRLAVLPEGAYTLFNVLKRSLVTMPPDLAKPLRQYQIHHFRDGSYELRLVMTAPISSDFESKILEDWKGSGADERPTLTIRQVDEIPRSSGNKFQDFTSDFMPLPDAERPTAPEKGQS